MVAIIPVAGAGTKLRPHTYSQPKSLIPIAGKPLLGYIIEQLREGGVEEFVFVIGYLGDKIKDFLEKDFPDLPKKFVVQQNRDGLGHAIWLTKDIIAPDKEIVIILGDTIMDLDIKSFLKVKGSALGVKKVGDPRIFGVAEVNDKNIITKVVEKPTIPKSNMALVGLYKLQNFGALSKALDYNVSHNIRNNNEFFLTDGLQKMIENGEVFSAYKVDNWYDCGQREVLLQTNAILLKKNAQKGYQLPRNFENTIIIDPVFIGENADIRHAIIGPNVTIGDNATIHHSILRDSIIGSYTRLQDVVLHQSVIGSDSVVRGASQSLNIGDNTELDLR